MSDAPVTVNFSPQLVERMSERWSAPVQCKLGDQQPDGSYDMWCRYPGGEAIPAEVVQAAGEQLYGADPSEIQLAEARRALEAGLLAWRP